MINKNQTISIIGCGWLGLPLGGYLVEKGYTLKGSTTRDEKLSLIEDAGIEPFLIEAGKELTGDRLDEFFQADTLLINIPPGRRRPDVETFHPQQIKAVVEKAIVQGISQILFIGSTGIYGNTGQEVSEQQQPQPTTGSGRALQKVETYLRSIKEARVTILRLSGLVGGDRKAGRFLAGKKEVPNGNAPVNLVHRDDCIEVIARIIEREKWGELYNLCADEHPSKSSFYIDQAQKQGFEPPTFKEEALPSFKIISNQKVKADLDYELKYPDPMGFP